MADERRGAHFTELTWEGTERNLPVPPRAPDAAQQEEETERQRPESGTAASGNRNSEGRPRQLRLWDSESENGGEERLPLSGEHKMPSRVSPVPAKTGGNRLPRHGHPAEAARTAYPPRPSGPGAAEASRAATSESEFVRHARELEHKEGMPAPFTPFKSYWPTYGHMTGAQDRWYFYWRSEVRAGRYPKTDLSYIFLHLYELINGIGWEEPEDGYERLGAIWEAYRGSYKRLDQYLGGWMADFSFVHRLDKPLDVIVSRAKGLAGDLAEVELMRCFSGHRDGLTLPLLSVMSDYDIGKSKFYEGAGQAAADRFIPEVVALIDAYVEHKHGLPLVKMFDPGPPVMRERHLFRSAVYDIGLYGYAVQVPVVRISRSAPLRSLITRLFRLTENKLRALTGFRGRLKGDNVDKDMDELIGRYLEREYRKAERQESGPAVVIDSGKLGRLAAESEQVRQMLTIDEDDDSRKEQPEIVTTSALQSSAVQSAAMPSPPASGAFSPAAAHDATPSAAPAEGPEEWRSLAAALTPEQRALTLSLAGMGEDEPGSAVPGGMMKQLAIDEINETAMDIIGDILFDGDAVMEEYVPMLSNWKR